MWSSRLFWKLFAVNAGLNLTLAGVLMFVADLSQRSEINRQVEQRLQNTASLLRSQVRNELAVALGANRALAERERAAQELQSLVQRLASETRTRLTLIDHDGDVLADSERDPQTMLNHADRPELITAAETGQGTARRPSPTLSIDMYYLALRVDLEPQTWAFVRVAVRLDSIHRRVARVRRFLVLLALSLGGLAAGLTYAMVGRIIRPLETLTARAQAIASGRDEDPVPVQSRDEVGRLAEAFNQMQTQLIHRFRQIRESSEQSEVVLSNIDDGILALDPQHNVVLANRASRELLNFVRGDVVGKPLSAAVAAPPLLELVRQCQQAGGSVQDELEVPGPPHRDLSVRATCLPGDPSPGVVVVVHDITELRRLENLRQEFVANVSHELKTPLASIKAYAETLRLGALNDAENNLGFVTRIEEQADRLYGLIVDMLQIARMETSEAAFEITLVPVRQVVDACVAQHYESAERKQIVLKTEPPDYAVSVRADDDGLRAILDNLVDNAIKYSHADGRVTVRWWTEDLFAVLEVQDDGIGIGEPDQARVFERFFRADKARSRELGGTGLGLSIVKHLSQAFGGSVVLKSQLGAGSTFQVRLPLG